MKSLRRLICFLLLGLIAVTLIAACNTARNTRVTNTRLTNIHVTNDQLQVGNCRVIGHEFGETCVPLKPQRIVALNPDTILDPLIALGIKPIGYTSDNVGGKEIIGSVSLDDVAGATNVGKSDQPSLEQVFMLKPDLILATKYHPYPLLSAIAPTVVVPSPNFDVPANEAFFKENLRYIAKVLGEETKAEKILDRYQKRIEDLKQRLGNRLSQIKVSVIYYIHGLVYTPAKNYDATADVLIDLGLHYKLPPSGKSFSIESVDEYNTDILFIINLERKPLSFFLQHPIFSRLKAVKNNRAYLVPLERWDTRGILGANQILDDLFKYLPENP
ncbi:MAG: putative ABC transporter substrate-binding lipoprotein YhfQ [Chroococcidiopsis cubana SAG 39.79]|uniref:ABC transporter substrate-binding lipoprotein YhfQ n=1 Tax=Chroococcidiopsis cubana SAG 39.79 TaxID=388085 RepID=A0AB37UGJ4_9CYAN|nr:iron-siderophore ABC transporter substrate-binding protein [Chroococcidiopsis cubana]MDZ4870791.1 putative ABC transporter substrate-binding lipoprotein YhfQ [Chroococcidiopsis cubana SAG 39.79]PSB64864.1 iron-siderophore ABC transporter substrate-binding protein [Chroococcidiopsis cubana CCALA 043]RUT10662.1 putative ABC transporter substrate-binding lipoprotein YhfQ [Chroococcidiopsis cubana SAG 39.79]